MAQAKKTKKKISKAMGEILKAPKKVEKVVKAAEKYVNKIHWDSKEAFAAAVVASGVNPNALNLNSEWDLYQSDTDGYKNHLKLEN
jgi:hypothetical protein